MEINISNLGPIKNVIVDTKKDMNIVVGENGTGKTYLSIMIYALMKNENPKIFNFISTKKIIDILNNAIKNKEREVTFSYKDIIFSETGIIKNSKDKNRIFPFLANVFVSGSNTKKIFNDINLKINNIPTIFNNIRPFNLNYIEPVAFSCSSIDNSSKICIKINDFNEVDLEKNLISYIISSEIQKHIFPDTFFFPAERAAAFIFNKELAITRNELFDRILESGTDNKKRDHIISEGKRYTLPIRNILNFANDISNISNWNGEYSYLADEIENDLLMGKLKVDKNGQLWFSHNKAKTKPVQLDMAASSVKALSSLVLFLRHSAKKGMTIFIDEPELNLHPNMQVKIARVLVKMVNNGIKVFVSTHSDYIAREINNMIIANEIKDNKTYDKELHLDKNKLDVTRLYYKNTKSQKLDSEKIAVDENGFTIPSIDEVIEKQNDINDDLLNELYKS